CSRIHDWTAMRDQSASFPAKNLSTRSPASDSSARQDRISSSAVIGGPPLLW
ncbi:hypothetical protein HMPREF9374_0995, partial [Desmospora sp. 8437]